MYACLISAETIALLIKFILDFALVAKSLFLQFLFPHERRLNFTDCPDRPYGRSVQTVRTDRPYGRFVRTFQQKNDALNYPGIFMLVIGTGGFV